MLALVFPTYNEANNSQQSIFNRLQMPGERYATPAKKHIGTEFFYCVNADDYDILTPEETAALVPIDSNFYPPIIPL